MRDREKEERERDYVHETKRRKYSAKKKHSKKSKLDKIWSQF